MSIYNYISHTGNCSDTRSSAAIHVFYLLRTKVRLKLVVWSAAWAGLVMHHVHKLGVSKRIACMHASPSPLARKDKNEAASLCVSAGWSFAPVPSPRSDDRSVHRGLSADRTEQLDGTDCYELQDCRQPHSSRREPRCLQHCLSFGLPKPGHVAWRVSRREIQLRSRNAMRQRSSDHAV